jgi:hypothetical protein
MTRKQATKLDDNATRPFGLSLLAWIKTAILHVIHVIEPLDHAHIVGHDDDGGLVSRAIFLSSAMTRMPR